MSTQRTHTAAPRGIRSRAEFWRELGEDTIATKHTATAGVAAMNTFGDGAHEDVATCSYLEVLHFSNNGLNSRVKHYRLSSLRDNGA